MEAVQLDSADRAEAGEAVGIMVKTGDGRKLVMVAADICRRSIHRFGKYRNLLKRQPSALPPPLQAQGR
jgi:hypothetical protein